MASIRQVGKRWRAEIRKKGYKESKTFGTKKQAENWATLVEAELDAGSMDRYAAGRDKKFWDALERYGKEVSSKKPSFKNELNRVKRWQASPFAEKRMPAIDTPDIDEWVQGELQRGIKTSSINRDLNFISNVFTYCMKQWRWKAFNPVAEYIRPKDPAPRHRRIEEDERETLLYILGFEGQVPRDNYELAGLYFEIAIETAMRVNEIHSITEENAFLDRKYIELGSDKSGKLSKRPSRAGRQVVLSDKAVELIKLKLQSTVETKLHNVSKAFEKAVIKADLDDLHFHDTRHEAISVLANKMGVLQLSKLTGIKDIRYLREVYYNPKPDELAVFLDGE